MKDINPAETPEGFKGTVQRIEGHGASALRTKSIVGYPVEMPTVGRQFIMYSQPLDPEAEGRSFHTSIIQSVEETSPGCFYFTTENSKYVFVLASALN